MVARSVLAAPLTAQQAAIFRMALLKPLRKHFLLPLGPDSSMLFTLEGMALWETSFQLSLFFTVSRSFNF